MRDHHFVIEYWGNDDTWLFQARTNTLEEAIMRANKFTLRGVDVRILEVHRKTVYKKNKKGQVIRIDISNDNIQREV